MTDWTQFKQQEQQASTVCELCEMMVPDAIDGALPAEERRWFEEHVLQCAGCGELWAESQRGAAWMDVLSTHSPEPSSALLGRILAQTSLAGEPGEAADALRSTPQVTFEALQPRVEVVQPGGHPISQGRVLPFRVPPPQPAYIGMHPRPDDDSGHGFLFTDADGKYAWPRTRRSAPWSFRCCRSPLLCRGK